MTDKKLWDIWSEGYSCTGDYGIALYHGKWSGKTFKDACINWSNSLNDKEINFNQKRLTYWGCRLFDNEIDARKSFG